MLTPDDLTESLALAAAEALADVLAARVHRKRDAYGSVTLVQGQLGRALRLPAIISKLNSKVAKRRQSGLEDFSELWLTLSDSTKTKVLDAIGWYDPKSLDWEDQRSNRRPVELLDPVKQHSR